MQRQSSERFNEYIEIIKNEQVVGFKLDNNDFQFLFDKNGGWFDEEGKYFNADAVQCDPPESQSDDDSQAEEKFKDEGKMSEDMLKLAVKENDDLLQIKRELTSIVESYPEGKEIRLSISLEPSQEDQDKIIHEFLKKKFNEDLEVQGGQVFGILEEQLAIDIIELEGTVLDNLPSKPNVYIDVQLYDSIQISFAMSKKQLEQIFDDLKYEKNVDYANFDQKEEDNKTRTYVEIRRDIEDELWDEQLQFRVENQ